MKNILIIWVAIMSMSSFATESDQWRCTSELFMGYKKVIIAPDKKSATISHCEASYMPELECIHGPEEKMVLLDSGNEFVYEDNGEMYVFTAEMDVSEKIRLLIHLNKEDTQETQFICRIVKTQ